MIGLPSTPLKLNDGKRCPGFKPTARVGIGCTNAVGVMVAGAKVDVAATGVVGAAVGLAMAAPDAGAVARPDVVDVGAVRATDADAVGVSDSATSFAGITVEVIGVGWPFRIVAGGAVAFDPQADDSRASALETERTTNDRRDGWACNC